ncbi:hypothetical protein THRCLA_09706 [Thraustotheca clavata]|uniref:Uncharacterized protein n=1 Tax=Thraustotheca clavata TaxID=74557 RepID=A0A1V9YUM2_9STRA|nr:hypothetical protein THRCLA_09706 [Thraustotheca clavata]
MDTEWIGAVKLDFDKVKTLTAQQYSMALREWSTTVKIHKAAQGKVVHELRWQCDIGQYCLKLRQLTLRSASTKAIRVVLKQCKELKSLEIMECHNIAIPRMHESLALEHLQMHSATQLTMVSLSCFLKLCPNLKSLTITMAKDVTSLIHTTIASHCPLIEKIILSQCGVVSGPYLSTLLYAACETIQWLDLSHCDSGAITGFEVAVSLPKLEGLIFDNLRIDGKTLNYINCPNLRVISLQNCRSLTDEAIQEFILSSPRHCLRVLDVKNTNVSQVTVEAIELQCVQLTHLGVESCRNLPLALRQKYALQAHLHPSAYERVTLATNTRINIEASTSLCTSRNLLSEDVEEEDGDYEDSSRHIDDDIPIAYSFKRQRK